MGELLQNYLNKQIFLEPLISYSPEKELQLVVIIPAFNEPDILNTLTSLKNCSPTIFPTEVLILINHSQNATDYIKEQNQKTYLEVNEWIKNGSTTHLKFYCVIKGDFPDKHAGVGLARKTLMDEACRRFAINNNEQGIISSLDADSLVSNNYLCEIQDAYRSNPKLNCTTFYFEHQLTPDISTENKNAILLYELYLRYFKLALHDTGFPYAFHTVGSSFAVRASAYAKQGGMSKRQAGEDFYFLHKIFPLGNCSELNNIIVYPSSRPSDRVPFGTGNAVQKILETHDFMTYNPIYFKYLKYLFKNLPNLYTTDINTITSFYHGLDYSVRLFIGLEEFKIKIVEINNNSGTEKAFIQRFYNWFDAFKIIKYLNFVHNTSPRIFIREAVMLFLDTKNRTLTSNDTCQLLENLKELELSKHPF